MGRKRISYVFSLSDLRWSQFQGSDTSWLHLFLVWCSGPPLLNHHLQLNLVFLTKTAENISSVRETSLPHFSDKWLNLNFSKWFSDQDFASFLCNIFLTLPLKLCLDEVLWRYLRNTCLSSVLYLRKKKNNSNTKLSINWPNICSILPMATHVANPISQPIRNVSPLRYLKNINQYHGISFNTLLTGYILNLDECKSQQRFCFKMPMMQAQPRNDLERERRVW